MELTFKRVKETHYTGLEKKILDDVLYLEYLASRLGKDIANVPITALVAEPYGDKALLNDKLFSFQELPKEDVPKVDWDRLLQPIVDEVEHQLKQKHKSKISSLKYNSEQKRLSASQHLTSASMALTQARAMFLEADQMQGIQVDLKAQLNAVMDTGFWDLGELENTWLTLYTKNAVVLKEVDTQYGIDTTVNMGKYRVSFDLVTMDLRVNMHSENLVCSYGNWHPYINTSGAVCWGNMADTVTKWIQHGNIQETLELLTSLLTTYGTGTPYANLSQFDVVAKKPKPKHPGDEPCEECDGEARRDCDCGEWCGACDRHADRCQCYYCDTCGESYAERCTDHWCSVCETYDYPDCNCCSDCGATEDNCERCRECDRHDGHDRTCTANVQPNEEEDV